VDLVRAQSGNRTSAVAAQIGGLLLSPALAQRASIAG
jgi:hypothetical protein